MIRKIESVAQLVELHRKGELIGAFEMPNEIYHAGPGISKSQLDDISRSPKRFRHFGETARYVSKEMSLGQAADLYLCDPKSFEKTFAIPPNIAGPLNKNPWKREWDEFKEKNPGKIHISPREFTDVRAMKEALLSHPVASKLVRGQSQISFFWKDPLYQVLCKCRPDFLPGVGICADLKTTDNASYYSFRSKALAMRYHVQAAFYLHGIKHAVQQSEIDFAVPDSFVFVVIERDAPYDIAHYQLDNAAMELGVAHFSDDLAKYKECLETDKWPGYKEEIQVMQLPPWAYKEASGE